MTRVILLSALITISCLTVVRAELRVTQVQVLFRHGDRVPRINELYPKDIHNVSEYEPWGFAQLTNTGKMRAYKIGRVLNTRYQDLLATLHPASGVYAVSTDSDRTKMSLQLLLAGLFPPSEAQTWNPELPWIPIPTHYVPRPLDILMKSYLCPEVKDAVARVRQLPEVQAKIAVHNDLLNFLSVQTGLNLTQPDGVYEIYNLLVSQKAMNLSLPEWCTDTVFRQMGEMADLYYEIFSYTTEIRRLHGGPMVRKFIENMHLDRAQENPRKIYLYSSHDITVSTVLRAHGIIVPEIPYGTAVILEKLQDTDGNRFIKLFRHGDRVPRINELYPKDIHNVSEYEPWGFAQLTNTGKMRAYKIGQVLNTRYQDLLATLHPASGVYAVSTDSDRTKMSLQLLLAGLFPPSEAQTWNPELPWIPIPTHYVPRPLDILMKSYLCPEVKDAVVRVRQLPEVQAKIAVHNDLLNFFSVQTGLNLTQPDGVYEIYNLLVSQKVMNLFLPEWCTDTVFRQMGEMANLYYEICSYTTEIRRLHGGPMLFRHGDRVPRINELYPKDIHNVSEYEPWGFAQLTNTGKMRAYKIGQVLNTRYQDLLATLHPASGVYAVSTDSDRTKMSLQLLLAGLFPPSEAQTWNPELPWIPIPTHYVPRPLDILMKSYLCPEVKDAVVRVRQLPEVQAKIAVHNDLLNFFSVQTGLNLTQPDGVYEIYNLLVSQKVMNLFLPEWCTDTVFRQMGEMANLYYEICSYTTEIRRLHGGPMVRKFIENMQLDLYLWCLVSP